MNRLVVAGTTLALLAGCNSPADTSAPAETASEPAAEAATADSGQPSAAAAPRVAALAAGTIVEATRQTQCRETGPDAGEPWDVTPGSFAKVIAVQGTEVLVDMVATECLIPADAVKPSKG